MFESRDASNMTLPVSKSVQGFTVREHYEVVKVATPLPLQKMSKENLRMLKSVSAEQPGWLKELSVEQRSEAQRLVEKSVSAHTELNNAMSELKAVHEFAEPLLKKAIKDHCGLDLDVNKVLVNASTVDPFDARRVSSHTLLEAALYNFPATDLHSNFLIPQCFVPEQNNQRTSIKLDVYDFIYICRTLNLGVKYQAHINDALNWHEVGSKEKLNALYVSYQKAALSAASYIALCKKDIQLKHYHALVAIVEGDKDVTIDGKPVWYRGLSFIDLPVHSCIVFDIADPEDESIWDVLAPTVDGYAGNDLIAYIPDDPDHPLKHYATVTELKKRLTEQFVRRHDGDSSRVPTTYQQFFSRFMRYKDRAKFYYSFTEDVPTPDGMEPRYDHAIRQQKQAPDFLLQLRVLDPSGDEWAQHYDLWTTLYKAFDERLFHDARDAAVSNEDADARDAQSFVATLLGVGLAALNLLSFAVPPLGLVMLGVSAMQLMYEVIEGFEELSKGDKEAGWEHITDVLENIGSSVAMLPLFVGLQSEFMVIEVAGGQKRLWKPDLSPYRSDVSLEGLQPDAQEQYQVAGKRYVRLDGAVFEKIVEPATGQARIPHPTKPQAYQPFLEQDETGQWQHSLSPALKPDAQKSVGFSNHEFRRYAVEPSEIAGLTANAKGIFRSAGDGRFYIRNIDAQGKVAVYWIRDDFNLSDALTDVIIVDPNTNRAQGSRLRQVAPDQWQSKSMLGGNITDDFHETDAIGGPQAGTSGRPVWVRPPFHREPLPNGLWEPRIEVVPLKDVRHLSYDWGEARFVPFSVRPTNIHAALSAPEFGNVSISAGLFNPQTAQYSTATRPFDIATQINYKPGGGQMMFSMERLTHSSTSQGEFNAIKFIDLAAGELPGQNDTVHGYWAPQGGYVDIPVHPGWGEPDHVFTPTFGGCSWVVDQMSEDILRVRHVEAGKEAAQYNDLPAHEHGWGLSTAMEFPEYGLLNDEQGNAYMILTSFAYMKYDRVTAEWGLHYQSQRGAPEMASYSRKEPGWFEGTTRNVKVYSDEKVIRTGVKRVNTVVAQAREGTAA